MTGNTYRWWNAAFLAVTVIVNGLAEWLPLNGQTTGEISAKYPAMITPAPYAFSIWSVIYLLLAAFVVYQLLPGTWKKTVLKEISPSFLISCVCNCAWIFMWHYERLAGSVCVMAALLLSLIIIYRTVQANARKSSLKDRWLIFLPFSFYMSWICVAFIVNVSVWLNASDWDRFGLSEAAWTWIMLVFAGLLAIYIVLRFKDYFFPLVTVWAFIAIAVANY